MTIYVWNIVECIHISDQSTSYSFPFMDKEKVRLHKGPTSVHKVFEVEELGVSTTRVSMSVVPVG